jgi:hypothetical protein
MSSSATQEYFRKLNTIALNLKMIDTELKRAKKGGFSIANVRTHIRKLGELFEEARDLLGED